MPCLKTIMQLQLNLWQFKLEIHLIMQDCSQYFLRLELSAWQRLLILQLFLLLSLFLERHC